MDSTSIVERKGKGGRSRGRGNKKGVLVVVGLAYNHQAPHALSAV